MRTDRLGAIDAAIFACYCPPADVLARIAVVANRVGSVAVIDDGTLGLPEDFYAAVVDLPNVVVIRESRNHGIAYGLNVGFRAMLAENARRIVTFDQDTTIDDDLLDALDRSARELDSSGVRWGVVGPGVVNGFRYDAGRGLRETPEVVQSGAVFTAEALLDCGLADESLVIDSVDTDMCLRMRGRAYRVYADGRIAVAHPIGSGASIRVLGRRIASTNHSAVRRYYMTRNRLEMFRRYGRAEWRWAALALRRMLVSIAIAVTIEEHRYDNARAVALGVWDWARGRSGTIGGADADTPSAAIDGIAVVLVTHNGARFLPAQLESIAAQTCLPDEVFLVDDGSVDGSAALVREYFGGRSIRVTCVPAPKRRSNDLYTRIARNFTAGIQSARGYRFIALSDHDDVWEPDRLARQRKRLESGGALMTAGDGALINADGEATGETVRDSFPALQDWDSTSASDRLRSVLRSPVATGAATMIDTRLVDVATPIPWGWLHDRWLSLVATARDELDVDHRPVIRYRVYADQAVGTRKQVGAVGWRRVLDGVRAPYVSARKLTDIAMRLRRTTTHDEIRRELRFDRVVGAYVRSHN